MTSTRRQFLKEAAALSIMATSTSPASATDGETALQARISKTAQDLLLPGFVAGVVRDGKLTMVQAEGFADLEQRTPMRRDHIFYVASLTKTFTGVMMMQYVQERKISLEDYVLDYPFLTVGLTPNRLTDPNVRLKHPLSHTSEGTPGDSFIYNGNRYNFVYGVFEKMSGNTHHYDAVAQEFKKRIADPLGLKSTLSGYPSNPADPHIPRIVKTYLVDKNHPRATLDTSAPAGTTQYPSAGLLTTVDDLAKYMTALDENALLSRESYGVMTQPFLLNDGRKAPYGLGWCTQVIGGRAVHWAYGYDDPYSALLIRVPEKKVSFVLLCNCGAASAPFYLGYGNLLTSPFAVHFLREIMPETIHDTDEVYAGVFLRHFTAKLSGSGTDAVPELLARLKSEAPERFRKSDRGLIYVLSERSDPSLDKQMETLAKAYDESRDFHPEVDLAIAVYHKRAGQHDGYIARLHRIADRPGYGEELATRDACTQLGTALLDQGQLAGRKYLWMAAQYAQGIGAKTSALDDIVAKMHPQSQ
jgi:CubicO group peptidase (beta-lactamase class C family)